MIPESEFKQANDFQYVTLDLLKEYHQEFEVNDFQSYMGGQTMPYIPEEPSACYAWDYIRWLKEGRPSQQVGSDWD